MVERIFCSPSTIIPPLVKEPIRHYGIDFFLSDVFCFTYFLSGFLFRVRGRVGVRDGVGDGFRVRVRFRASVRARWGQGFIHHNPNLLELKLRPSGKTRKKQKIVIGLEILSEYFSS